MPQILLTEDDMKTVSNKKINEKLQTKLAVWQIDQIQTDMQLDSLCPPLQIPGWKAAQPTAGTTKLRRGCTVSTSQLKKEEEKKKRVRVSFAARRFIPLRLPSPPIIRSIIVYLPCLL